MRRRAGFGGLPSRRTVVARGTHHRNRRAPQCREVDPLQRADEERRPRGELSLRDDRAQRGSGRRTDPRCRCSPSSSTPPRCCRRAFSSSTSRASSAARLRVRAWKQVLVPYPRGGSDLPGDASLRRRRRHPVEGRLSPADDISTIQTELVLADLQTVEKAVPRLEKEARLKKENATMLAAVREAQAALGGRARRSTRQPTVDKSCCVSSC